MSRSQGADVVQLFEQRLARLTSRVDEIRGHAAATTRPEVPGATHANAFEASIKRSQELLRQVGLGESQNSQNSLNQRHNRSVSAFSASSSVTENPAPLFAVGADTGTEAVLDSDTERAASEYSFAESINPTSPQHAPSSSRLSFEELQSNDQSKSALSPQDEIFSAQSNDRSSSPKSVGFGGRSGSGTIVAQLMAKVELQEEQLSDLRVEVQNKAALIPAKNDELQMLRHKLQEVLLRESTTRKQCEILEARAKDQDSEIHMLRLQLEGSLEANRSIQGQLDEIKKKTESLDEQAIAKAKRLIELASTAEIASPMPGSPLQKGWV